VSESGISQPDDVRYLKRIGADAFLVGTSIMQSNNIKEKVRQLVMAI
ncbi:MAG: indole-3-glycerol-phosphate synthase, partial [Nitrososphaerales archaeon]